MEHVIINRENQHDWFSDDVMDEFQKAIAQEIANYLDAHENHKDAFLGSMILKNVPLKTGERKSVYVEYNAFFMGGLIDAGIQDCIIFDDCPDIVLDRYNKMKTLINEKV